MHILEFGQLVRLFSKLEVAQGNIVYNYDGNWALFHISLTKPVQGLHRSWKTWKLMEFEYVSFQVWQVMELNCCSGKVIENYIMCGT